ncbi:hypothetical protein [Kineococcus rhizosphaerae]|uniref:hypothetical protein n=1 Tax=Kineococcus rhizosphaerae TaxID=559628 RepID=UPI000D05D7AD|nr:hypothetical protein [Kineococcus rhizosphaerae]
MPVPEPRTTQTSPTFVAELSDRVQRTRATIDSAAAAGDDDLAQALLDDLEALVDLAAAQDVALPDTVAYLADRRPGLLVDLTRVGAECATA